jgi:hypothetical protein
MYGHCRPDGQTVYTLVGQRLASRRLVVTLSREAEGAHMRKT